jgi:WD40 repeat protein
MIKSCISPDGNFIASGSEDGIPFLWEVSTGDLLNKDYECKFIDSVTEVDWNPRYNMIATCGFGEQYPILVYVFEKSTKEIEKMLNLNFLRQKQDQLNTGPDDIKVRNEVIDDDDFNHRDDKENFSRKHVGFDESNQFSNKVRNYCSNFQQRYDFKADEEQNMGGNPFNEGGVGHLPPLRPLNRGF